MYPFTKTVSTKKFTKGVNACSYIIIHHTATPGFESNVKYLSEGNAQASVHFVIGKNGETAKIGDPKMILWHAGVSSWGNLTGMNKYSMGIEIVGTGEYNIHQLIKVTDLVEYLMGVFNIPKENVLRHSDICQAGDYSKKKILWDGKRSTRKIDVGLGFFVDNDHFKKRRDQLVPRTESRFLHSN